MQPDWLQPPFAVTDLIAALLWVLAALYATLQRRDHEPGMGWFAVAMLLFGVFVGNNAKHLPTDPVWLEGTHGWYWKNVGTKPIKVTLVTSGEYEILGVR